MTTSATTSATIDIDRATPRQVGPLSATLAQAFHDDPVLAWVIPDPSRRPGRLRSLFAGELEAYLPLGETYRAGPDLGAAMWAPPGTRAVAEDQTDAVVEAMAEVLQEDLDRALTVLETMEPAHPRRSCFYLQWLGIAPDRQGRGLGTRLLRTVLDRCDREATPAYLEATSRDNLRLYERHGFEVMEELTVPAGPPIWPMWREAGAHRT